VRLTIDQRVLLYTLVRRRTGPGPFTVYSTETAQELAALGLLLLTNGPESFSHLHGQLGLTWAVVTPAGRVVAEALFVKDKGRSAPSIRRTTAS
jgi:hypothetical protein